MQDHKKVQTLFQEFEKAQASEDEDACERIAEQVCSELDVHASLEEELFYPAARDALEQHDEALIDEAEVEHQSIKDLIAALRSLESSDPRFSATFTVLAEYVRHHVKEEEGEIFPKVKKATLDTDVLGEALTERKLQLMEEMGMDVPEHGSSSNRSEAAERDFESDEDSDPPARTTKRTRIPS